MIAAISPNPSYRYFIVQFSILQYFVAYYMVYCSILQYIVVYYSILQYIILHPKLQSPKSQTNRLTTSYTRKAEIQTSTPKLSFTFQLSYVYVVHMYMLKRHFDELLRLSARLFSSCLDKLPRIFGFRSLPKVTGGASATRECWGAERQTPNPKR